MAVTQQLARVRLDVLHACRVSVEDIDAVCSFKALKPEDYLDLNWYPAPLVQQAERTGVASQLVDALRLSMEGASEVNPAYRDVPNTIWEHPVNCLLPEQVADVAVGLERLLDRSFPQPKPELPGMAEAFAALCAFYRKASEQHLALMMWWD